jgi:membrane-bound metal-dependent hydrolase YbcI (DUF457 family)
MLLGHYGLAFAAKRAAPRTSLGTLVFAAQFLDELWPILLLLGVERVRIVPGLMKTNALEFVSYPVSHSLLMALVWGALIGGAYYASRRDRRAALVVGALVASHWFLDAPMHRPDLPLWPGGPRLGGGLWNSVPATVLIELALFGFGLFVYLRRTRARDGVGRWGLWSMVALLLLIFLGGLGGAAPPGARAVAIVTLGLWLFVPWAAWVDRHREPVAPVDPSPPRT